MSLFLNRAEFHYITTFYECLNSLRQATHQQIFLKEVHKLVVHRFRQGLLLIETLSHGTDCKFSYTIGIQEFLKIHWIHMLNIQTSHWNRLSILQSHSQQGTAGNVSEPLLFHQEFHKSQKMIIGLYLVNEYKSILPLLHLIAGNNTQSHIKVLRSFGFCKNSVPQFILFHIDFNVVGEHLFSHMSDNV